VTGVSLVGVSSYLPETVVPNEFFGAYDGRATGMFRGARERRHIAQGETASSMIVHAAERLRDKLGISFDRDVDLILTNVSLPDMPFTGCGAVVGQALGARTKFIVDLHNTGCVSFIFMMDLARSLMQSHGATSALICNVQSSAGRVFRHERNQLRPQSAVPGDGCGVGYMVANEECPILSIATRCHGEYAEDMQVVCESGEPYWEPRTTPLYIDFSEQKVASIIARGNRLVPEIIKQALVLAERRIEDISVLVTNQPNALMLRNWREALLVPPNKHVNTYEEHGNLFGAAMPICIERAIESQLMSKGDLLVIGGFSHAGDYSGAAVVEWSRN